MNRSIRATAVSRRCASLHAFTIIELLVVITIIIILAGLVLSTIGYAQKKGARSRAQTEVFALAAAIESYRSDNGIVPRSAATDDAAHAANVHPTGGAPANFIAACQDLYKALSGDFDGNPATKSAQDTKSYFTFKTNMLSTTSPAYIRDPFGNSYGYSTAYQADVEANPANTTRPGYNPTFDLWSTCGETAKQPNGDTFQQYQLRWVKNW